MKSNIYLTAIGKIPETMFTPSTHPTPTVKAMTMQEQQQQPMSSSPVSAGITWLANAPMLAFSLTSVAMLLQTSTTESQPLVKSATTLSKTIRRPSISKVVSVTLTQR